MVISQSLQHYSHLLILDIINIVDKAYIGFQKYICTHLFISMEWHAGSWKSINYMLNIQLRNSKVYQITFLILFNVYWVQGHICQYMAKEEQQFLVSNEKQNMDTVLNSKALQDGKIINPNPKFGLEDENN